MSEFDNFNPVIEFAKFWECFDTKELYITSSRKGVKSKCLDVYKKHVKDQQKADVVLFALVEHKKHYQKCIELGIETKGFHQGVSPWLNGKKWVQQGFTSLTLTALFQASRKIWNSKKRSALQ